MSNRILFSKYANDRPAKYSIATDIIEADGRKIVRKRAMTQDAKAHVDSMATNHLCLEQILNQGNIYTNKCIGRTEWQIDFAYIEGKRFDLVLDDVYQNKGKTALVDTIRGFFQEIEKCAAEQFRESASFRYYFGETSFAENTLSLSVADADLLFKNIIQDEQGKWCLINHEWLFDGCIPVEFLKYRALMQYLLSTERRNVMQKAEFIELFSIDPRMVELYAAMEKHFEQTIEEGYFQLADCLAEFGAPVFNARQEFSEADHSILDVYFDHGEGFSENDKKQYMSFPVRIDLDETITGVRIDPMREKGLVTIDRLEDQRGNWLAYDTNGEKILDNCYYFASEDPQIILSSDLSDIEQIIFDAKIETGNEQSMLLCRNLQTEKKNLVRKISDLEEQISKIQDQKIVSDMAENNGNTGETFQTISLFEQIKRKIRK